MQSHCGIFRQKGADLKKSLIKNTANDLQNETDTWKKLPIQTLTEDIKSVALKNYEFDDQQKGIIFRPFLFFALSRIQYMEKLGRLATIIVIWKYDTIRTWSKK